jgi:NitT/TauT family transport system substrate-binding protein
MQNRRHFLKTGISLAAAGIAGAAALTAARRTLAEEAPPETTLLRLLSFKNDTTCLAPLDILDDLLRDEGFTDVRYVPGSDSDITGGRVVRGNADFTHDFAATAAISIDAVIPKSCWLECTQPASSCSRANRSTASSI